jgi:hypothetical protein
LGLLLHYFTLVYAGSIICVTYYLYCQNKGTSIKVKSSEDDVPPQVGGISFAAAQRIKKVGIPTVWIVPAVLVLMTVLFGIETGEGMSSVYRDVHGNDKLSMLASSELLWGALLIWYIFAVLASLGFYGGSVMMTPTSESITKRAAGGGSEDKLSSRETVTTGAMMVYFVIVPITAFVAVGMESEEFEYIFAIFAIVMGLVMLLYAFVKGEPPAAEAAEVTPATTADDRDIVLNASMSRGVPSAPPSPMPYAASPYSGGSPRGAYEMQPMTYQVPHPFSPQAGESMMYGAAPPSFEDNSFSHAAIDTNEFDNLIFSLKADVGAGSISAPKVGAERIPYDNADGLVGLGVVEPSGRASEQSGMESNAKQVSIADTHL